MGIKTITLDQLPSEMDKIYKNLMNEAKKTQVKDTRLAGNFMVRAAKKLAPSKSGDTERGVVGRKEGKSYAVISSVPGSFPYNFWLDNRAEMPMVKGRPYSLVQKTGIQGGGFFTIAGQQTAKYFKKLVVKDMTKWETVK